MNPAKPWNTWLWWIYILAGVLATGWGAFCVPDPLSLISIVSDIACTITLLAIFGYVAQRPLGYDKVWSFIAPIVIAIQVALFIYELVAAQDATVVAPRNVPVMVVAICLGAALAAPSIWALYAYAFRSAHVWQRVHA